MKLEVDISRSRLFFIVFIFIVVLGLAVTYAYNSSPANPSVFGHSTNEISPPNSNCVGKALIWNGTNWDCSYQPGYSNLTLYRGGYATIYWTVPIGVQRILVKCWGAGGGGSSGRGGGAGGYAEKIIRVSEGDSIGVSIGQESTGDGGRSSVYLNGDVSRGVQCDGGKSATGSYLGGEALYGDINIRGATGTVYNGGAESGYIYGRGGTINNPGERGAVLIYY